MTTRHQLLVASMILASVAAIAATATAVAIGGGDLALGAVASVVVGAYLTVRVPGSAIGPVLACFGAAAVVSDLANAVLGLLVESDGPVALSRITAVAAGSVFVLVGAMACILLLLFPSGRPIGHWVWVVRVVIVVAAIGFATGMAWSATQPLQVVVPALIGTADSSNPAEAAAGLTFAIGFPLALASLATRYRRTGRTERLQIGWLLFAGGVLLVVTIVSNVLDAFDTPLARVGGAAGFAAFPIAVGIAVTRYRLYEIDRIVSRTVTYAVVVGGLALVFAAGAVWLPQQLPTADNNIAVAVSTLTVAALFSPVRRRVQRVVDRRFHRLPYDPETAGSDLAASIRDEVEPGDVVAAWTAAVRRSLRPATTTVWIRETPDEIGP